jgi:hypothetical protein
MVLVEVDAMMMHATSVSSTTRMLSVLSHTSVTMRHVSAKLSGFAQRGSHFPGIKLLKRTRKITTELIEKIGGQEYFSPLKHRSLVFSLSDTKTPQLEILMR